MSTSSETSIPQAVDDARYTVKYGYSGTTLIYEGRAEPGSAVSAAKWQIKKFTYDGGGSLTDVQWASGNDKWDKVWDSRTDYTYS